MQQEGDGRARVEEVSHPRAAALREWLAGKCVGQAFQPAPQYPILRVISPEDLSAVRMYRRRMPHWELPGSTYFVTFRVAPVLGQPLWNPTSPNDSLGSIVEQTLWFSHGERYGMDAYVVMPDHVHVLLKPLDGASLAKVMQGIKGFSARALHALLGRRGAFWQAESFDHVIRNEADWLDKVSYIHDNPVVDGLVERAEDFPFSSLVTWHAKGRAQSVPGIAW